MNKNELPLIINPKTGGVFHQIGVVNGVKCGFRVWLQSPSKSASSALIVGFRIRLVPENPLPEGEVFKLHAMKLFPKAKWAGLSLNHVSMAGEIMVRVPFWKKEEALEALNKNDIGGRLADYLNEVLPGFDFDREEFADYFLDVLNADYAGAVDTTDCDGLVLFAPCEGQHHMFKDGYEVTPVVTTPSITQIAEPPKVDLVKKETKSFKGTGEVTMIDKDGKESKLHLGPANALNTLTGQAIPTYQKLMGMNKPPKESEEQALGYVKYETVKVPMSDDTGNANGSLTPEDSPSLSSDD